MPFGIVCGFAFSQSTFSVAMVIVWSYGVEAIDFWIIFQWKLNEIEIEKPIRIRVSLVSVESPPQLKFNRIFLLEIQTNCKNWIWNEKSVEPLMCSHLGQQHYYIWSRRGTYHTEIEWWEANSRSQNPQIPDPRTVPTRNRSHRLGTWLFPSLIGFPNLVDGPT